MVEKPKLVFLQIDVSAAKFSHIKLMRFFLSCRVLMTHQMYFLIIQTTVWQNFTSVEKNFLEPLRQALKVTRIQYQAELLSKQDEMKGNKRKKAFQGAGFNRSCRVSS